MMRALMAGLASTLLAATISAADVIPEDGLSGAEVNDIVHLALKDVGISADPQIAMVRSFPACDHIPSVAPKYDDWTTISLTCTAPSSWTRAVRTQVSATYVASAGHENDLSTTTAVVVNESLPRGTVLTAAHLELQEINDRTTDQIFSDPNTIIGRKLTVNLGEGRAVLARHLEIDWLIRENNPVAIVYSGGVFAVTAAGVALQDGQLGELIEVRNIGSDQTIKAIVADRNKVLVAAKMN